LAKRNATATGFILLSKKMHTVVLRINGTPGEYDKKLPFFTASLFFFFTVLIKFTRGTTNSEHECIKSKSSREKKHTLVIIFFVGSLLLLHVFYLFFYLFL